MKTHTLKHILWGAALSATLLVVGCGRNSDDAGNPPAPTAPVDERGSVGVGEMSFSGGETVTFVPDMAAMSRYVVTHPLNAPKNFKINIKLSDVGGGRFGGVVSIAYNDNGQVYYGKFVTGTGSNQVPASPDFRKSVAEFNRWVVVGNKQGFRGFFQDKWGAIILVIDNGFNLGDGGGLTDLSGRVYFKNFPNAMYPQYSEMCWFVRRGPYDCRTYVDGSGNISTTQGLYPGDGYTELGRFTGVSRSKAFAN